MELNYPFRLVKIDAYGLHPFISAYIEKKEYNFLIDIGSSKNFLDIGFFDKKEAEASDLSAVGFGKHQQILVNECATVNFSGVELLEFLLCKCDMSEFNSSLSMFNLLPVNGILGCDIMHQAKIKIDFENNRLVVSKSNVTLPFTKIGEYFYITTAILNDKPVKMIIDTGASQTVFDSQFIEQLQDFENIEWMENDKSPISMEAENILDVKVSHRISFKKNNAPEWDIMFNAFNMNCINEAYKSVNIPDIHGILGCDFLFRYCKRIDFQNDTIVFQSHHVEESLHKS